MSARSSLIAFASVVVAGLVALLISGASDQRATAFSLDVPYAFSAAILAPGVSACQGPIATPVAFKGVRAWISPTGAANVGVSIRDLGGRRLASGVIHTDQALAGPNTSTLDAIVSSGPYIDVCLSNRGPGVVTLLGSTASSSSGELRVSSKPSPDAFTLVLLRPHPRTLLSLIPTLFARAALFKASWVGAWTFWILCIGILAAFGLTAAAVASAVRAEPGRDRQNDP